ncbi:hypothetical protein AB0N59_03235 [Microbacterium sp. NPDC089321]|uniref:hypothetical protein n=1 Tax=Microbacterium sp. NPDC089321 TaxID=3155183 RepID=UPI0034451FB8
MRSALNANTFYNTVALARQNVRTLILVVEGDDDHLLVKRHVNDEDVLLIAGVGGKPVVLDAARIAERRNLRGVRFMIDIDYDPFTSPTLRYPANVIESKNHDAIMDVLIIAGDLIEWVMEAYARSSLRSGAWLDTSKAREDAYVLAASVAPLRVANDRHQYGLKLSKFPFGQLPNAQPGPADLARLVVMRSGNTRTQADVEADIIAEATHLGTDHVRLVGDHDYFRALAKVLQLAGVTGVTAENLWTGVLVAIACVHLGATDWYQRLSEWGAANSRATFTCPCAA